MSALLAAPSSAPTSFEALTLGLDGEIFALEASIVREIRDLDAVTAVPGARPFVGGIINVRGKIVPLADLRLRFGMEPKPPTIDSRIVVVEILLDGEASTVGILADKVYAVTEIAMASVRDAPRVGVRWRPEFIRGVGKLDQDFVILPNIDRIFG